MAFEDKAQTGGIQCSKRNYKSICQLFGQENCVDYKLQIFLSNMKFTDKLRKLMLIFKGYSNGSSDTINRKILAIIKQQSISHVFVDSSLNGKLVKLIKQSIPSIRIVVFFHNCEYLLVQQDFLNGNLVALARLYSCYLNEKLTCKYADKIIALNQRDSDIINKYFHRSPDIQIPISLQDICDVHQLLSTQRREISELELLFVGSNFYPNVQGISWFIKEVLPWVNAKLIIIGRNLKGVIPDSEPKVTLLSNVEDLSCYYYKADVVIAPIFKGSGMKVKIAEAMMYGKPIIGTTEAFQGYRLSEDMFLANDANEFVQIINTIQRLRFSESVRELYVNQYSFDATLKMFKTTFEL